MTHTVKPLAQWTSRFGFIMAAAGAAVGLGNIWKFPYMAGDNGGSAFVLVYLICVAAMGIPALMGELLLGRLGQQNPVNSLKTLAKRYSKHPAWQTFGWLGAITLLIMLSFYSVVAGWSLAYVSRAFMGVFNDASPGKILEIWSALLANPWEMLFWHSIFSVLTLGVVAFGVKKGVERASKIMMPSLFIVLMVLVGFAFYYGDVSQSVVFLFQPRFSEITPQVIIDAMGHAFFTLAIGAGAMIVYGAYVKEKTPIASTVVIISLLDILVAFLAGFAIFPLLFQYGLTPEEGPGLMFKVLPITFSKMPHGQLVGTLFFILLFFAAWTSSLSMGEPLAALLVERLKIKRSLAALLVGIVAFLLGIISLLAFNVWSDVRIFDRFDIFSFITDLVTNVLLPLGVLGFSIFAGFKVIASDSRATLKLHGNYFILWHLLIRYITPVGILVVMVFAFI